MFANDSYLRTRCKRRSKGLPCCLSADTPSKQELPSHDACCVSGTFSRARNASSPPTAASAPTTPETAAAPPAPVPDDGASGIEARPKTAPLAGAALPQLIAQLLQALARDVGCHWRGRGFPASPPRADTVPHGRPVRSKGDTSHGVGAKRLPMMRTWCNGRNRSALPAGRHVQLAEQIAQQRPGQVAHTSSGWPHAACEPRRSSSAIRRSKSNG